MGNNQSVSQPSVNAKQDQGVQPNLAQNIAHIYQQKISADPNKSLSEQTIERWFGISSQNSRLFYEWALKLTGTLDEQSWTTLAQLLLSEDRFPSQVPDYLKRGKKIELLIIIFGGLSQYDEDEMIGSEKLKSILEALFTLLYPNAPQAYMFYYNRIQDDSQRDMHRVAYISNKLNSHLPVCQNLLKQTLRDLICQGEQRNKLPKIIGTSELMKQDYLVNLCLTDFKIYNAPQLHLLYSNIQSGTSFNRLAWNIMGYGGPTLFIIRLTKKQNFEGQAYPIVFGAYQSTEWSDGLKYQGDATGYIFSVSPIFKQFTTYAGKGGQNYSYLNTKFIDKSKYKVGLGFGGSNEYEQFRIWLDDDLENKSSILPEDDNYALGDIAGDLHGRVEIDRIEIFGLGGQLALDRQQQYRQERQEEQIFLCIKVREDEKSRQETILQLVRLGVFLMYRFTLKIAKTFAHKGQVREDVQEQVECQNKARQPVDNC